MKSDSSLQFLCLLMVSLIGVSSLAQSHWTKRNYYQVPIELIDETLGVDVPAGDCFANNYRRIDGNGVASFSIEGRATVKRRRKQTGLNSSYWGFTVKDGNDSVKVTLRQVVDDYGDFFDKRYTRVTTELNGNILCSRDLADEFSTESGRYNSLGITYNYDTSTLSVFGGARTCETILDFDLPKLHVANPHVYVWAVGEINLSSLSAETTYNPSYFLSSDWTMDGLNEHFAHSSDPIEGYWEYLDRKNDPKYARLGGRYVLAIVKDLNNSDDYNILYIDGAETLSSQWTPFMIKGSLKGTAFQQHYDLTWFDSTFQLIDKDIHASITDNAILTLNFPLLKTELRFSKNY